MKHVVRRLTTGAKRTGRKREREREREHALGTAGCRCAWRDVVNYGHYEPASRCYIVSCDHDATRRDRYDEDDQKNDDYDVHTS